MLPGSKGCSLCSPAPNLDAVGRDRREERLDGRVLCVEEAGGGCFRSLDGTKFPIASRRCPGSRRFPSSAGQGDSGVTGASPTSSLWTVLCWAKSKLRAERAGWKQTNDNKKIITASWLPSGQEIGCLLQMPVGIKKILLGRDTRLL